VDLDGDGLLDVVAGTTSSDDNGPASGSSYVFYGPLIGTYDAANADVKFVGEAEQDRAGNVAYGGDINGDGFEDLLIGANQYLNTGPGLTYVIYGSGM
jgi:hypothetical protein